MTRRTLLMTLKRALLWLCVAVAVAPILRFVTWRPSVLRLVRFKPRQAAGEPRYRDGVFLVGGGGTYAALSARCPHLGCTLEHDAQAGAYRCPCHGSCFDGRGARFAGPAQADMARLEVRQDEDGSLVVVKT